MSEEKKFDTFDSVSHSLAKSVEIQLNKEFVPLGGVLPDPESNKGKNWMFGGKERPILREDGNWTDCLPNDELQATKHFDPYSCVSESAESDTAAILFEQMMRKDPSIRVILSELGCLDDNGKVNFSARWIAVGSGTIPGRGNSQYAVFEFIRKNGLVGEKHCPSRQDMTEKEYFTFPNPAELKALGKKFLEYFNFEYEDVEESPVAIGEALKRSPLCVVLGGAYLGEQQGAVLYRNSGTPIYNHQAIIYRQEKNAPDYDQIVPLIDYLFDTYVPFRKKFIGTYPFKFIKAIYITLKKKLPMFRLAKTASSPAVYILCENSLSRLGLADSPEVEGLTGGTLLKLFCGNYGSAGIEVIKDEDMIKYKHEGNVNADLFNK